MRKVKNSLSQDVHNGLSVGDAVVHQLLTPISAERNELSCSEIQCSCCKNGKCDHVPSCHGCIDGKTGLLCEEPCPDNCYNCSQRFLENDTFKICYSCNTGFYNGAYKDRKDQPDQQDCSLPCAENCFACSSYKNCDRCKTDYYLTYNRTCEHCLPECRSCLDKARYFWTGTGCQQCSVSCMSCTSKSECIKCDSGYYIENGVCLRCRQGCISCEGTLKCSECEKGFLLVGGECQPCQGGCEECELDKMNHFVCLRCKDRFFLLNGTCFECSSGCITCKSKYECDFCDSGYMAYDRLCHKCLKACINCSSVDKCLKCKPSFYVNNSGLCYQCPENCALCSGESFCEECYDGFWGKRCDEPCGTGCISKKCNNTTGECLEGCSFGVTEANCSTAPESSSSCKCQSTNDSSKAIVVSVVSSVGAVLVIITAAIVFLICVYKRRRDWLQRFLQSLRVDARDARDISESTPEEQETQQPLTRLSPTLEVSCQEDTEVVLPLPDFSVQTLKDLNVIVGTDS